MIKLPDTLEQPDLPFNLPKTAIWLAGEGAGSWFVLVPSKEHCQYKISRYSPKGKLECSGVFYADMVIQLKKKFEITYPSHCQTITVIQGGKIIKCQNGTGLSP